MNAVTLQNEFGSGGNTYRTAQGSRPLADEFAADAPLRILVIDDEPSICEVLDLSLSEDGHTVATACDGGSGLDRFYSGSWDVILVDRAMPDMSGFELAAAMKKHDPHTPVIMVSGFPEITEECDEASSPIDVLVRKPFTRAHLRDAIRQALWIHSHTE